MGVTGRGGDNSAWQVAGRRIDPLVPSFLELPTLRRYVQQQLGGLTKHLNHEEKVSFVDTLTKRCRDSAKRIANQARELRRLHNNQWDDASLGLEAITAGDGEETIVRF